MASWAVKSELGALVSVTLPEAQDDALITFTSS
jgi:hypothetical protein